MPEFKMKKKETPELVPSKPKKKTPVWVFVVVPSLILALALIVGGTIFFNNYQEQKAKEESYKTLQEALNVKLTADKRLLTIEAGPELTYTPTEDKSLEQVPDQVRNLIVSYTGDSEITVSNLDISTVGEKQLTLTITKADRFGQVAQKQERVIVTVKDTQEPQVDIVNAVVHATNEKEAEANVLRIYDPAFGYYPYSSTLENHTYKIELPKLIGAKGEEKSIFDTPGIYQAKIIINDSGNIIERYYDVNVGNYVDPNAVEDETTENVEETTTEGEVAVDEQTTETQTP